MADPKEDEEEALQLSKHIRYFKRTLDVLPVSVQSLDTSRMTLLFFSLSGLDLLGSLDDVVSAEEKQHIIDWIYAQQILPSANDPNTHSANMGICGFRGSSFLGTPFDSQKATSGVQNPYDTSHIAMSYTALACLLILGDDLSRVNKPSVLTGLRKLQLDDGSFCSTAEGSENDMRFIYCACCVSAMLNDWSGIDMDKAVKFIKKSQGYDYGIGQGPYLESHGGSTFCAVASLYLMNKLEEALSLTELEGLKRWCIGRQQTGFQGRPNKPVDTCYSFWIGASLKLLDASSLVDKAWNRSYVLSTQGRFTGGFSKWPDSHPDPMHTYLGLCGLSLQGEDGLGELSAALNISQRAANWLKEIQRQS